MKCLLMEKGVTRKLYGSLGKVLSDLRGLYLQVVFISRLVSYIIKNSLM